jgi:methylamine utilization protein MauE
VGHGTTPETEGASAVVHFVASLVGMTLIIAGAAKLGGGRQRLSNVVARLDIVSPRLKPYITRYLGPAEVLLGTSLIAGIAMPILALGASALFVTFSIALGVNLAHGRRDADCGCFGSSVRDRQLSWVQPLRALLLASMALAVGIASQGRGFRILERPGLITRLASASVFVAVFAAWRLRAATRAVAKLPIEPIEPIEAIEVDRVAG